MGGRRPARQPAPAAGQDRAAPRAPAPPGSGSTWSGGTTGRRPGPGFRVFAAYADPASPWLETATLDRRRGPARPRPGRARRRTVARAGRRRDETAARACAPTAATTPAAPSAAARWPRRSPPPTPTRPGRSPTSAATGSPATLLVLPARPLLRPARRGRPRSPSPAPTSPATSTSTTCAAGRRTRCRCRPPRSRCAASSARPGSTRSGCSASAGRASSARCGSRSAGRRGRSPYAPSTGPERFTGSPAGRDRDNPVPAATRCWRSQAAGP